MSLEKMQSKEIGMLEESSMNFFFLGGWDFRMGRMRPFLNMEGMQVLVKE